MNEWSLKLSRPSGRIYAHPSEGYLAGAVLTPHGIVDVYSQGGPRLVESTNMTFIANGRMYSRSINRAYTKRGLVTLAARFAAELSEPT